ncbi:MULTISPECIES: SDR family oxidoreductase [unclassified Ruegeria]|uniref:SDR family oxidoreductase n=1 Tax=unclassified Ruegeria TaxID=2625375 RepID=UPI001492F3B7|nr:MULTISPECIES: SDR family oxidoreductase [unclassified Ruegeria]NOD78686.1 SDR family NAD(P)-dependent oxidoreductase [Ruegeria sp. HKCCD4332]NOD90378.1 SDR family NAD(P)-dependent oxidoreductase [Ruegeria sp. HKCCD4318]NOE15450.1 SDR family NAD(P)-dependent oxidoreductase [Ruegeria sp. HKCCD4318-2]NOG10336.1 SDR family oxidoreductase [Ruegeria sp. HKCCD4315]
MQGKTVLITGASRGIGAEAGRVFAAAGANVALVARSHDQIDALAAALGDQAIALACDVSDFAQVEQAVATCVDHFGGLDVLIGNAGVIDPIFHLSNADVEAWSKAIDINLKGVFYGMRAALPIMRAAGGGSILTISSGAASNPVEAWSHYCASKAGAKILTECLHLEEAHNGIRAMGLSPGTVATDMQRSIKASGINPVSQLDWDVHIPADWPARALLWMCSDDADEFLGTEISLRLEDIRKRVGLI